MAMAQLSTAWALRHLQGAGDLPCGLLTEAASPPGGVASRYCGLRAVGMRSKRTEAMYHPPITVHPPRQAARPAGWLCRLRETPSGECHGETPRLLLEAAPSARLELAPLAGWRLPAEPLPTRATGPAPIRVDKALSVPWRTHAFVHMHMPYVCPHASVCVPACRMCACMPACRMCARMPACMCTHEMPRPGTSRSSARRHAASHGAPRPNHTIRVRARGPTDGQPLTSKEGRGAAHPMHRRLLRASQRGLLTPAKPCSMQRRPARNAIPLVQ